MLSHPLPVVALVSHYLTNKLIGHRPLPGRRSFKWECLLTPHFYRELSPLSRDYARPQGRLPMCYAPVCHASLKSDAFDLHALDTPPAFILSQDQTL